MRVRLEPRPLGRIWASRTPTSGPKCHQRVLFRKPPLKDLFFGSLQGSGKLLAHSGERDKGLGLIKLEAQPWEVERTASGVISDSEPGVWGLGLQHLGRARADVVRLAGDAQRFEGLGFRV